MKGPAFIAADGRRLPVTWHRLKPSDEVTAEVPEPGEPEVLAFAPGDWNVLADGLVAGEGFDRRRFRVREWSPAAKPVRLFAGGQELKPTFPSAMLDDDGLPRVRYRSLPLDRPWLATELERFEQAALEILALHCYPVDPDFPNPPIWRQVGENLCWAVLPLEDGALEGEKQTYRLFDGGWILVDLGPLSANWPAGSPFRWAQTVYRLARTYRMMAAELLAAGCPAAPLEAIFQAAFELGSAMTEDTFRRLYDGDVREGQAVKRVRSQAGQKTGAQRRQAADTAWRGEAQSVAKALRAKHPTWGQKRIAKEILSGVENAPEMDTIVATLRGWEKSGDLEGRVKLTKG